MTVSSWEPPVMLNFLPHLAIPTNAFPAFSLTFAPTEPPPNPRRAPTEPSSESWPRPRPTSRQEACNINKGLTQKILHFALRQAQGKFQNDSLMSL